MSKTVVQTDAAPGPVGGAPYSQGVVAGGMLFTSGQVGFAPDGTLAGEIAAETHRVFDNLTAILHAGGASLDRVVKTTVFMSDLGQFSGDERRLRRTDAAAVPGSLHVPGRGPPGRRAGRDRGRGSRLTLLLPGSPCPIGRRSARRSRPRSPRSGWRRAPSAPASACLPGSWAAWCGTRSSADRPGTSTWSSRATRSSPPGAWRGVGRRGHDHPAFGTATVRLPGGVVDLTAARAEQYPSPGSLPVVRPADIDADLAGGTSR
jgi:reactive intermediate/imine deaminase